MRTRSSTKKLSGVRKKISDRKIVFGAFFVGALVFIGVYFTIPSSFPLVYNASVKEVVVENNEEVPSEPKETVTHVKTPEAVKAIYMSSCVLATPSVRKNLVALADSTEINSIVIDIKDYSGKISFTPKNKNLLHAVSTECKSSDVKEFLEELHDHGIYTIGRITVFQDPHFAKLHPEWAVQKESDKTTWKDNKGLSFTDPGAKGVWDYIISIAKESYDTGFDELNFDYIRYPSDGPMKDIYFPMSNGREKAEVLESFFDYLDKNMSDTDAVLSADLFGMTTVAENFDLNIGQLLETALPHFDYVAPMIYPSHFPPGFNGWANPNDVPYEIIKHSLDFGVAKTVATSTQVSTLVGTEIASTTPQMFTKPAYDQNKIRPWLQDFDYGGDYDAKDVRAQIQATYDAGLNSWMLWSPSNRYTKEALFPK